MISVMFCFDQAMDRKEAKITYLFHIYPCLNIRQVLQFSVLLDVNIRVVVVMSNKMYSSKYMSYVFIIFCYQQRTAILYFFKCFSNVIIREINSSIQQVSIDFDICL